MTDIEAWPDVAPLGGSGRSPAPADPGPSLPAPVAAEVGRAAPLVSGAGVEHGAPPERPGVMVCRDPKCRAEIRMALTEDRVKPMPVDADPHPDGNLVWRKIGGQWRMHVLRKTEHADPGERRFRPHFETCTSPDAFRKREKRQPDQGEQAAVATLDVVGLNPERIVERPGTRRARTPAPVVVPGRQQVLLAVDGNSLAHRAYHAYERSGMRDPDGGPLWAVYGFLALLAGVVDKTCPDAVLVGFDDREASARRDRYPDYKAGRADRSPDLYTQLDALPALLDALGVAVSVPPALEADDVLASAAAAAERAGWRCTIATSDKDSFALITDRTTVLRLVNGLDNAVTMTPGALLAELGVTPGQYRDFCALVGDKSDNLPGVNGIGKVKAAQLLRDCGSLDAALADPGAAAASIGKAYAGKLVAPGAADVIVRNRDLMAAEATIPVDPDRCRPVSTGRRIAQTLRDWHLPSLIDRVTAALRPVEPEPAPDVQPAPPPVGDVIDFVTREAAPSLAQVGADQAEDVRTCPTCATVCPAAMPPLWGTDLVLLDAEGGMYDRLAVLVGETWRVRQVGDSEKGLPFWNRRGSHRCPAGARTCQTPGHETVPARLTAGGVFCPDCLASRGSGSNG